MIRAKLTDGTVVLINNNLSFVVDAIKQGNVIAARREVLIVDEPALYVYAPHITNFQEAP